MQQLLTLGSFAFFTALVGLVTYRLTRKDRHDTSESYFLAGRMLTAGFIAGSLMLTNLSTEQLVGLNGAAFEDGLCVMAWEVIAALALVLMALFFLPCYLKSGITTVPQFLEERFDSTTRAITAIIFIVAYTTILLPIILYTGATGLIGILDIRGLTGISSETGALWLMVWLIGIIGSLYAIVGGLRTVAVSDTLNGLGLLVGGLLIAWLGLAKISPENPLAALSIMREAHPEKFNTIGGPTQSVPFSTLFTGVLLLNLFYWCTNQQIIQRTFGASSLKEGQKGVLMAGGFKVLSPIILVLPGMIAFHLYASEDILKDHAYRTLVRDVLPPPLTGFFAAVMVGAILSSFNSALNSTATLFSLGVYQHMLHPTANEQRVIKAGKMFAWIIAITSMTVAPLLIGQESIFAYLQKMRGLYFIPIFSVVVIGILARRVPAKAANLALVLGSLAIAAGYFVPALSPYVEALHEFHFLGLVFFALIALMLIISLINPRSTPWQQRDAGEVDLTPWKYAKSAGFALVAVVLAIYISFADFSVLRQSGQAESVTTSERQEETEEPSNPE